MNIQIRVLSRQAQAELKALRAQVRELELELARANRASGAFGATGLRALGKWGSQLQWAGRQLTYNFTLPLAFAGVAATKFALDNEKAMTRLQKVYGDGTRGAAFYAKEINSLGRAFEMMSNKFGVVRSDVINIAADWAAAGASGIALAKSTQLTLQTMILGELEATEATEALISIQAQYGESIDQLAKTIDTLNMIENQTGISMKGLIQGFQRAAGVARSAGIDVEHLGAMLAALVPASGSAAQAGNAIKTIVSRLLSPTKEAAEVMGLMGINTQEMSWQTLNGTQRLEKMAESFKDLSTSQRAVVSSVIASRWQINKFDVLMRDMINTNGYYQKSLRSTSDATANQIQREKELNAVLESSPKKFDRIMVAIQNVLANAVVPLLPDLIRIGNAVAGAFRWFQALDPNVRKLAISFLVLVAALGPAIKLIGATALLLRFVLGGFKIAGEAVMFFGKAIWFIAAAPFKVIGAGIGLLLSSIIGLPGATKGAIKGLASMRGPIGLIGTWVASMGLELLAWAKSIPVKMGALIASGFARWIPYISGYVLTPLLGLIAGFFQAIFYQQRAFVALSAGMWQAWQFMLAFIQRAGGALMITQQAATHGILTAMTLKFTRGISFLWTTMTVNMRVAWTVLMFQMRVLWTATILFLTSPVRMLAGIKALFAGMAAIMVSAGPKLIAIARIVGTGIATALTGPIGLAVVAAVGLFFMFRDQLADIWNNITGAFQQNAGAWAEAFAPVVNFFREAVGFIERAFWRLPQGVRDALMAVVRLVQQAASGVQRMFSSVFSFFGGGQQAPLQKKARGGFVTGPGTGTSDSVLIAASNGEYVVNSKSTAKHRGALEAINADRYATGGEVGNRKSAVGASSASADLAAYRKIAEQIQNMRWQDEMATIAKGLASALPLFKSLLSHYRSLNAQMTAAADAVDRQERVVRSWEDRLKSANDQVDRQRKLLDSLEVKLDTLTSAYDAHSSALQNFAQTPIIGMREMGDEIFANEMAQKRLQLQMMKWEDVHGSIDDVRNSMALLQGEIESMNGNIADLRMAGAGSDITGPLQDQVDAMRAQYGAMQDAQNNSPVSQMQEELAALQREAQRLDLENSLKFDPMLRQIDQLANGMKELPFSQIIAGIEREQAAMDALQPKIDAANAAVEKQKAVTDAATAARDAIQARYDAEGDKLERLRENYRDIEEQVNLVEGALRGLSSAASDNVQKMEDAARKRAEIMSPGAQNFLDAAGANFPEVGEENNRIGREGGFEDQAALIDEWIKNNSDELTFDGIDMFKPIRDMWDKAWKWVEDNVAPGVKRVWEALKSTVDDIFSGNGGLWGTIGTGFRAAWDGVVSFMGTIIEWIKQGWKLFGDDIMKIFAAFGDFFLRIWNEVGPKLGELFKSVWDLLVALWPVIQALAAIIGGALLGAIHIIASVIANTLGPVLNFIIDGFNALIQIVKGVVDFFVGVFTLDIGKAFDGILQIIGGTWDAIFAIFNGVAQTIWGIVKGFVEGIVGFFSWLWDVLVGNSIVPDLINAIVDWFKKAGKWLLETVGSFIGGIVDWFKKLPGRTFDALATLKNKLSDTASTAFTWFWNKAKEIWNSIWTWVTGLPQKAYDGIISIRERLGTAASSSFNWFWTNAKTIWGYTYGWITGLPQKAWDGIIALRTKLGNIGTSAMNSLWTGMKSIWDGSKGVLQWFKDLPSKAANALKGIASAIATAVKNGWNSAANWINDHAISPVNAVTSKFGLNIPRLPTFAKGGIVPGGESKTDNMLIAARSGEGVIVPEAVKMLGGKDGIDKLNRMAEKGKGLDDFLGKQEFGVGGVLENVANWLKQGAGFALDKVLSPVAGLIERYFPRPELMSKFMSGTLRKWATEARTWGKEQDSSTVMPVNGPITAGYGRYPSGGIHRGVDFGVPIGTFVKAFRGGNVITSGWDSTGFGNFVEIMHANDIISRYGHNSRLLKNVGDYVAAGTSISMSGNTGNSTGPHLHFEIKKNGVATDPWPYLRGQYDRGGYLQAGMTMARNATGKPEPVFTSDQWAILSSLVATSSSMLKMVTGGGAGGMAGLRGYNAASIEGRMRRLEGTSSATASRDTGRTVIINGDLVLPNIKSGDDAEAFIKHLESLVG